MAQQAQLERVAEQKEKQGSSDEESLDPGTHGSIVAER
jgi:hypothetical protein